MSTAWLTVPTPAGELDTMERAVTQLKRHAESVLEAQRHLTRAGATATAEWVGQAQASFVHQQTVADLALRTVASAHHQAATAVDGYAAEWHQAHSASQRSHQAIQGALAHYRSAAVSALQGVIGHIRSWLDNPVVEFFTHLVPMAHEIIGRLGSWAPPATGPVLVPHHDLPDLLPSPSAILGHLQSGAQWGISHLMDGIGGLAGIIGGAIHGAISLVHEIEQTLAHAVGSALRIAHDALTSLWHLGTRVAATIARVAQDVAHAVFHAVTSAAHAVARFGIAAFHAASEAARALLDFVGETVKALPGVLIRMLTTFLYTHPWVQELLTRMAPGLIQEIALIASIALAGLPGGPILLTLLSGGNWPTTNYEQAVEGLQTLAQRFGLLEDDPIDLSDMTAKDLELPAVFHGDGAADLMDWESQYAYGDQPQIAVTTVTGPDGVTRYIVNIPGTEEWGPQRDGNGFDLTSNVQLMTGREAEIQRAVLQAMKAGGVPPGADVMLVGHSQGGMIAGAIASDPSSPYHVTSVLTAGSPIGRDHIPSSVSVLSVEHRQDIVPKLDGASNPSSSNWRTVTVDQDPAQLKPGDDPMGAAHEATNYATTLSDLHGTGATGQWESANAAFLGGTPTKTTVVSVGQPSRG